MSESPKVTDPRGLDVFDFDVLEENWNDYELEDTTKIRSRLVLSRVARPKQGFKPSQYDLSFNPIVITIGPPEKRSTPGPPLSPEEIVVKPEDIGVSRMPVKPITSSEQWNIYRVRDTGDVFRVKMLLTEAYRVMNRFDQFGEPAHVATYSLVITPVAKGYEKVDLRNRAKQKT